jgi:hypothetical protein
MQVATFKSVMIVDVDRRLVMSSTSFEVLAPALWMLIIPVVVGFALTASINMTICVVVATAMAATMAIGAVIIAV